MEEEDLQTFLRYDFAKEMEKHKHSRMGSRAVGPMSNKFAIKMNARRNDVIPAATRRRRVGWNLSIVVD